MVARKARRPQISLSAFSAFAPERDRAIDQAFRSDHAAVKYLVRCAITGVGRPGEKPLDRA
jgi:hypothetical protein